MTKLSITIWALLVAAVLISAFLLNNRPRKVIIGAALPAPFPEQGFSHDVFETLLSVYVSPDGRVDYDRWHASADSRDALDSYLAAVSRFSPERDPQRFMDRNDELAYWMYGYNAYVIKAVLDNWPISSVTDIAAPIEAVKGMGFFYRLRYSFGGEYMSLLTVENRKIRARYRDARIHFVLNCASESCPVTRRELPTGDALEELMDTAAREFISDSNNVSIDHKNQTVSLSRIFKWYKRDFINDLRAKGLPVERGLVGYVAQYADESLQADLHRAADYTVEFRDYDWSLNETD
jgi:hypothetical protein